MPSRKLQMQLAYCSMSLIVERYPSPSTIILGKSGWISVKAFSHFLDLAWAM